MSYMLKLVFSSFRERLHTFVCRCRFTNFRNKKLLSGYFLRQVLNCMQLHHCSEIPSYVESQLVAFVDMYVHMYTCIRAKYLKEYVRPF